MTHHHYTTAALMSKRSIKTLCFIALVLTAAHTIKHASAEDAELHYNVPLHISAFISDPTAPVIVAPCFIYTDGAPVLHGSSFRPDNADHVAGCPND